MNRKITSFYLLIALLIIGQISADDCLLADNKYLKADGSECTESCEPGEMKEKLVSGQRQCKPCANYILSTIDEEDAYMADTCVETCPIVTDKANKKCLSNKDDCKMYLSDEDKVCDSKCPDSSYTDEDNHKCYTSPTSCKFITEDKKCLETCNPGFLVADEETTYKTCKSTCSKYYSISESEIYCDSCPKKALYSTKGGDANLFTCSSECTSPKIPDTNNHTCIDVSQCVKPSYLINDQKCGDCPDGSYKFDVDNTQLRCKDSCTYKDAIKSNNCLDKCENDITYTAGDQIYCGSCPSDYPLKNSTGDAKNFICKQACGGEFYLLDEENHLCLKKADCTKYITEDNKCALTCSDYLIPDENEAFKTCKSTCTVSYQVSGTDKKYCGSCPTDWKYTTKIDDKSYTCDTECGTKKITDTDLFTCIDNCPKSKYLINKSECSGKCPPTSFTFKTDTDFRRCNDKCELYDGKNDKNCFDECEDGITYTVGDKSYCQSCPSGYTFKQKIDNQNKFICKQTCEGDYNILLEDQSLCIKKTDCTGFITDNNQCTKECSGYLIPEENGTPKTCKSKCDDATYQVSETEKYCQSCPSAKQYTTKIGEKSYTCDTKCDTKKITDTELFTCIDKMDCIKPKYLLNSKECSKDCSPTKFTFKIDTENRRCNDKCDYIDGKDDHNCLDSCTDNIVYSVGNQNYCSSCPSTSIYKVKVSDTKFTCQANCDHENKNQYTDTKNSQCLASKNECVGRFITDDFFCKDECDQSQIPDEGLVYKTCTVCSGKKYSVTDGGKTVSYCDKCPKDYLFTIPDGDNFICLKECSNQDYKITDVDNYVCLQNAKDCGSTRYLINSSKCSHECDQEFKLERIDNTMPTQCNSECLYNDPDPANSAKCYETCTPVYLNPQKKQYCNTCPDNFPAQKEVSSGIFECSNGCADGEAYDVQDKKCIVKEKCEKNLVDGTTCTTAECKKFTFKDEITKYRRCDTECALRNSSDLSSKICNLSCPNDIVYDVQDDKGEEVNDYQFCTGCPKPYNYKTKNSDKKYICTQKCKDDLIVKTDSSECIKSSDCTSFLLDNKSCEISCGDKFVFDKAQDQSYTKCATDCTKKSGDSSKANKCYDSCPGNVEYKVSSTVFCDQCPPSSPYFTKVSSVEITCTNKCPEGSVSKGDTKECIKLAECSKFVIDDSKCSDACPDSYYLYAKNSNNSYQICKSTCKFLGKSDDGKFYCQDQCNGSKFATKISGKDISYCDTCPKELPIKSIKSQSEHICVSTCPDNQIPEQKTNTCVKTESCTGFVVDGKSCEETCDSQNFKYPTFKTYKKCDSKCDSSYLTDKTNKKCYASKSECPSLVSKNGKFCEDKCENEFEFIEKINGVSLCRACRQYLNKTKDSYECISSCSADSMVLIFGEQNEFKQCVDKSVCKDKKISVSNPKECSAKCLVPEVTLEDGTCAASCPKDTKFNLKENSCHSSCDTKEYQSADKSLCVSSCEKIFEVVDGSTKNCKACDQTQTFVLKELKGTCITNNKSDDTQTAVKQTLKDTLGAATLSTLTEVQKAKDKIADFSKTIEENLSKIASQATKSDDDQAKAKSQFQDVLDLAKALIKNTDPSIIKKPVIMGDSQLKVTSQVAQPGQRFKLSFDSSAVQSGSVSDLLEKDPDESSTTFTPSLLQVSYIKNNHFCKGDDCKNSSSLISVSYETPTTGRLLAAASQEFTMVYTLTAGQDNKKQVCLNYDSTGAVTSSQGVISGNQITCKFTSSSGQMYDTTCKYVDQSYCTTVNPEPTTEESGSDDDGLNGGAIAGIVIGVIAGVGLIAVGVMYYLRIKKQKENISAKYTQNDALETDQQQLKTHQNNDNDSENQRPTKKYIS